MDARKTYVALCHEELGKGAKWGLFFEGDTEPFGYLNEGPEERVLPFIKQGNAHSDMAGLIGTIGRMKTTDEAEGMDLGNDEAMNGLILSARTLLNTLKA